MVLFIHALPLNNKFSSSPLIILLPIWTELAFSFSTLTAFNIIKWTMGRETGLYLLLSKQNTHVSRGKQSLKLTGSRRQAYMLANKVLARIQG